MQTFVFLSDTLVSQWYEMQCRKAVILVCNLDCIDWRRQVCFEMFIYFVWPLIAFNGSCQVALSGPTFNAMTFSMAYNWQNIIDLPIERLYSLAVLHCCTDAFKWMTALLKRKTKVNTTRVFFFYYANCKLYFFYKCSAFIIIRCCKTHFFIKQNFTVCFGIFNIKNYNLFCFYIVYIFFNFLNWCLWLVIYNDHWSRCNLALICHHTKNSYVWMQTLVSLFALNPFLF